MQINISPICKNFRIENFIVIILSIQLAVWGVISLDSIGLNIPILRQALCFIYLTFLPGILLLRLLGFRKTRVTEIILYSVGLSLIFIMSIGCFLNFIYPLIGIHQPLTLKPLLITISGAILILCGLYFIKFRKSNDFCYSMYSVDFKQLLSKEALFFHWALFLSIFGTYIVNFYGSNFLLLVLIPFNVIILLIVVNKEFIREEIYILAIFLISISMLFHYSLFSMYITGADVHVEYYFANLVKENGFWNASIAENMNATLSTTMLASIFSILCDTDTTWVFKVMFPIIFSLVPLGIYLICREQLDKRIAFLSAFFFMSVNPFYGELLSLPRQQIAEFFLILIILVMLDKDSDLVIKRILLVTFLAGLTISHYGLTYLFLGYCIAGIIFMNYFLGYRSVMYSYKFIIFFTVIAISWYLFATGGSAFESIIRLGDHAINSISEEILCTTSVELATKMSTSFSNKLLKYMYLLSQLLISIGFLRIVLESKGFNLKKEYGLRKEFITFSFMSLSALVATTAISYTGMNIHRLYHIALICLSPFCLIGGITILEGLSKAIPEIKGNNKITLRILSIFLVMFFLLDTGWFQEIVNDPLRSLPMGSERIKNSNNLIDINSFYSSYFPETDIFTVKWLAKERDDRAQIYADLSHKLLPLRSYGMISNNISVLSDNNTIIEPCSYTYLGYYNLHYNFINGPVLFSQYWNSYIFVQKLTKFNVLCSNGYSNVYYS